MLDVIYHDMPQELLDEYWDTNDKYTFTYSLKYLISKYGFSSKVTLENKIKQYGYAISNDVELLCPKCTESHLYYTRSDFKIYKQRNRTCYKCETDEAVSIVFDNYIFLTETAFEFNKIYNNNMRNKVYCSMSEVLGGLSFLELVYYYVIINRVKPNIVGVLGPKLFPLFLHEEHYSENTVIQTLIDKGLLFHTVGISVSDKLNKLSFCAFSMKNRDPRVRDIYNDLKRNPIKIAHIIWKPNNYSFKDFSKLLLERIDNYNFSFEELESISIFLQSRRTSEVFFLSDVVEYNHDVRLKRSCSVEIKVEELTSIYNIRLIYGYLLTSMSKTYYKLDFLLDFERKILKNIIYTHYFSGSKVVDFSERKMPGNYRKSKVIIFIEECFKIEPLWEDVSVNVFVEKLIDKIDFNV